MCFTIFQSEKTLFKAIKTSSKSRKIEIFSKGLTYAFGPKTAIFRTFFFLGNIDQENVIYDILQRKNAFQGYKNNNFKKSKNSDFSKGVNPCFCSKNGRFSNCFFKQYRSEKMCSTMFQNEKTPVQAIKTTSSKKGKIEIFPKGPVVLVQKWPFFQPFFLGNIGQENVFYDILERKNAFLDYNINKFKTSKN